MTTRTCSICGKQFESKHYTVVCPECKIGTCVVCGTTFNRISPYTQKTCSPKCRGIYRAESGIGKQVGTKMKQTKLSKYGTLDPSKVTIAKHGELPKRICLLCGKEFQPDTVRQIYCKDVHYVPCPVCGKLTELKDVSTGPQACSEKCRIARINATCLEKYGNKDAVNSEHAKILAKQHSLERYGVEHPMQSSEIQQKVRSTTFERYGVEYAMQNAEIQERTKQTNLERYGTEYPTQSEEIKAKSRKTVTEHYGGFGLASPQLRERIVATNQKKYGVDFITQQADFQRTVKDVMLAKYGYENYQQTPESKLTSMKDPSKVNEWMKFLGDPAVYIQSHYQDKPPIYTLCKDLGVTDTTIYDTLLNKNCSHLINHTKQSTMEYEIVNLLKEYVSEDRIVLNTRRVISPLEVDIWLPDYNLGIECNPTITHNSSIADPWGGEPKAPSYHKYKTDLAVKSNVFLYHVFGYEWAARQQVIESMIVNLLGYSSTQIYARNTVVKKVERNEACQFLDANHRQGSLSVNVYYGLYTSDDKLVSLMSFNKLRPTMGKVQFDVEDTYELSRFCNLIGTNVVGGASKLLKHFIQDHKPKKIVSFSDRAHTRGGLYSTLGFHQVSISDPSYVWVNLKDDSYLHRVTCQKSNLRNLFKDDTIDIEHETEREIMIEHGYVQVYDCGVVRWELDV